MYYVPVTDNHYRLPTVYVPIYSTATDQSSRGGTNEKLKDDLSRVRRDLASLRGELNDLRLENEACRICSPATRSILCDETCSICYPRPRPQERKESYSRSSSPVHYCSICQDYVIGQEYPPLSPRSTRSSSKNGYTIEKNDRLSAYELDRYIPETRPVWIPTAYKQDYPHRRWTTRQSYFS